MFKKSDIEAMLGRVHDYVEGKPDERWEFAFHMTDWLDDLADLVRLFQSPQIADSELHDATQTVMRFLGHVIPHISAASLILLDEIPKPLPIKA